MPIDADVPRPPSDLAARSLPILDASGPWLRVHRRDHEPAFFGRTLANRFDDPEQEYGVLYVAETLDGAFIETFGRSPGVNAVSMRQLAQRSLARVGVNHPLRLVDLTGAGLARLGTTAAILSGPHQASRAWSRALWLHPGRPDGLLYRARHDPSCLCAAIFDRAEPAVRVTMLGSLLAPEHRASLGATLRRYDFSLRP